MKMGKKGIALVTEFEGLYLNAYLCPANVWTIGYGHTGKVDKDPIKKGMKITKEKAIILLKSDMAEFENVVKSLVKVKINQNQFDALVSFSFNVGAGALKGSTLLKKLNEKKYAAAADEFLKWNKGGGRVLPGLTRRRKAERELFLTPIEKRLSVYGYTKFMKDLNKTYNLKDTKGTKTLLGKLPKITPTLNNNVIIIKYIKKYLKKRGYFKGKVNTSYDTLFKDALKKYKTVVGLDVKNVNIDKETWTKLLKL